MHIAGMATLTIRDLPEYLHLRLKDRARRNRRSLNQEVIAEIAEIDYAASGVVREEEHVQTRAEWMLRKATDLRKPVKRFFSAGEIESAKQEGRR
jgi:plasmid stability protein